MAESTEFNCGVCQKNYVVSMNYIINTFYGIRFVIIAMTSIKKPRKTMRGAQMKTVKK